MRLIYTLIVFLLTMAGKVGVAQVKEVDLNPYQEAIATADSLYQQKDYINAKASYQYALRLNPDESYPKEMLQKTMDQLRLKMEQVDTYDAIIRQADDAFRSGDMTVAIERYREAARIFPDESYPALKIAGIDARIEADKQLEDNYIAAIQDGDHFFAAQQFDKAIKEYDRALSFKPAETYPAERITVANNLLKSLQKADIAYAEAIAAADRLFDLKYYSQAGDEYQKAILFKPGDSHSAARLAEIGDLLRKKEEYDKLIDQADELYISLQYEAAKTKYQDAIKIYSSESYPKGMIDKINEALAASKDKDEWYAKIIADADRFFNENDLANAQKEYANALSVKPQERYPQDRISEIESLMKNQQEIEERYQLAIKNGDAFFAAKQYSEAREEFEKAQTLKKEQSYPSERIKEIDVLITTAQTQQSYEQIIALADKLLAEKRYEEARAEYLKTLDLKPQEKYPAEKVKEMDNLIKNLQLTMMMYNQAIEDADRFLAEGRHDQAIASYQNASGYLPTEQYPKQQIFEINKQLDEKKAIQEQYSTIIREADNHLKQSLYEQALSRYEAALALKPDESYPKTKVQEITGILDQISLTDGAYNKAIADGEALLTAGDLPGALSLFGEAASIKPDETYPGKKMAEIKSMQENQAIKEAEYNKLIGEADKLFAAGKYPEARSEYDQASRVMAQKTYPKEKMAEIDALVLAQKNAAENAYNEVINQADSDLAAKAYEKALEKYREALTMKPGEEYPLIKVAEIERLLVDLKTLQANFTKLVSDGDAHFKAKEYDNAKAKYLEASKLFPEEQYPKTKMKEINKIFQEETRKIQEAYNKAIADADKFYNAKVYDQAIDGYRLAHGISPEEPYPQEMVARISRIIEENAVRNVLNQSSVVEDLQELKIPFEPVSISDRKSNYIFVRAKNRGANEFRLFLNYGKDGGKNGGVIIRVPPDEEENEFFIRIGQHYKWYTEANNWLSFTSEGGELELIMVKISGGN